MDIRELLEQVRNGTLSPDDALNKLKMEPFEDLGYAKVDHHRKLRQGEAEIIFGQGKTPDQIIGIMRSLLDDGTNCVLATRVSKDVAEQICNGLENTRYCEEARLCIAGTMPVPTNDSYIAVVTAGTTDIPVAEEAAITAEALGNRVERIYDVGVAGIHRLFSNLDVLMKAKVVIVLAGMEGALVSVVGGLVDSPVIAVPTSVGYGASFEGLSALLSMLNSCASGVSVVNIDNGFGAGYLASMINKIGE